ncbi:hypothetical protein ZHAS_00007856 [Anopheles sinensis]|uniref:Uncharacterized protein n=1 Tax=Anopheles sinensis TaxID=74873 RepID=A0A084VQY9_ANOSI|nr:hypothetical protein ZHAS_00007856 [Anopheles sinensis]
MPILSDRPNVRAGGEFVCEFAANRPSVSILASLRSHRSPSSSASSSSCGITSSARVYIPVRKFTLTRLPVSRSVPFRSRCGSVRRTV